MDTGLRRVAEDEGKKASPIVGVRHCWAEGVCKMPAGFLVVCDRLPIILPDLFFRGMQRFS